MQDIITNAKICFRSFSSLFSLTRSIMDETILAALKRAAARVTEAAAALKFPGAVIVLIPYSPGSS